MKIYVDLCYSYAYIASCPSCKGFPGRQGRMGWAHPAVFDTGLMKLCKEHIEPKLKLTSVGVTKCRWMSSRSSPKADPLLLSSWWRCKWWILGCKVEEYILVWWPLRFHLFCELSHSRAWPTQWFYIYNSASWQSPSSLFPDIFH